MTMKPFAIGIGYIVLGIFTLLIIRQITNQEFTPGTCVGTMSVMVLFASYLSYDMGKKVRRRTIKKVNNLISNQFSEQLTLPADINCWPETNEDTKSIEDRKLHSQKEATYDTGKESHHGR